MDADILKEVQDKYILHWNYRDLLEVPEELREEGEHIQEIYLKWNNIGRLPRWLGQLKNLTNLYLYGNHLDSLPDEIEELESLLCLDVGQNRLACLPSTIGKLSQLSVLCATSNCLTYLPNEICQLTSLKVLLLSGNMLSSLPESICRCTDLEELCLDENCLTNLPQQIVYLPKLSFLSVAGNQIIYLPAMPFVSSPQLRFEENPQLNYLAYCLGSQISSNAGPANESIWNLETYGCFESNVTQNGEVDENVVLHVTRHFYPGRESVPLVMPQGLLTVCKPADKRAKVPSLHELAIREVYRILYRHEVKIECANGNHTFSMSWEPLRRTADFSLIPRNIDNQLSRGPVSVCSNPDCCMPIFTYAIAWVIPKYTVNKTGDLNEILSVVYFCSHHCSANCTLYDDLVVTRIDWQEALAE